MDTPIKGWEPSEDKRHLQNIAVIAAIAFGTVGDVVERQIHGLADDHPIASKIRSDAFALTQTIERFVQEQTSVGIESLEQERAEAVKDIRTLQVQVMSLNNRSKFLEHEMTKVDSENLNLQSYNIRAVKHRKPGRFTLPHEAKEWEADLAHENAKMQKLNDTLNAHKVEYAEVNAELNQRVSEFNAAQAKEESLYRRIQMLKRSPEFLKEQIKAQLLQLKEREMMLRQALAQLPGTAIESVGVGFAG